VDDSGLGRFVLVGHSMGAAVAADYASRHPVAVSRLLLIDPAGDNTRLPREQMDPYREALRGPQYREVIRQYVEQEQLPNARTDVRERVLANVDSAPPELSVNATLASIAHDIVPQVASYRSAGGRVVTVTADRNQGPFTLHALLPDLPRRHISGTSHFIHMDDPAQFNRVLDEAGSGIIWKLRPLRAGFEASQRR
jgi:pimeloyl-ACP methyl ester carboxylesterase